MDQVTTFREKYQQGTAYMSGELKSIERHATGVFREEENRQLEQEYMSAMEQGHVRMRMFGMEKTTFGKMEEASVGVMANYCQERKEAQRIHQITESGKKKKSAQETDAQARMGNQVNRQIRDSAGASASNVLRLYQEKKQQNIAPADTPLDGTEFYTQVKNQDIDAQTRERKISDLMLRRDALALRVKNAAPKNMTARAECEYEKQLLEKMNDVLRTWMATGGISGEGKRISEREKTKAAQHLALAVESYEYYVKDRNRLIGGMLFEQVKKTDKYKEQYRYWRGIDKESSRQILGIDQPILNIYKDDIASLRSLISENGPYDEQKQALITSVYGEYMQHSVAFANMNQEMRAVMQVVQYDAKQTDYVNQWWDKNDYAVRQHEMVMDAATAYLKYLIRGKMPDPTLAVYIEQHWHTDAFAAGLDETAGAQYGDQAAYEARMRERITQIEQDPELSQEIKRDLTFKLSHSLQAPQNQQAERLLSTSDVEVAYNRFVREECQVTDHDPAGGGYRDIVRLMMPVNGSTTGMDAQDAKARKCALVKFAQGKYLGDEVDAQGQIIEEKKDGMECPREERLAELPVLLATAEQAYQDLNAYLQANQQAFGKISLADAYRLVEIPTKVYKKAQAMRDMCGVICGAPLFGELDAAVQSRMIELWNFGGGLTEMAHNRTTIVSLTHEKTLRELTGNGAGMIALGMTLEDYVAAAGQAHEQRLARRR